MIGWLLRSRNGRRTAGQAALDTVSMHEDPSCEGPSREELLARIGRLETSLKEIEDVALRVKEGDLEARLLDIRSGDPAATTKHALNHMLDMTDAFVREAEGSLQASMAERFHRRFLQRGLRGSFARGAEVIDTTITRMEEKVREVELQCERHASEFRTFFQDARRALGETAGKLNRLAQGLHTAMAHSTEEAGVALSQAKQSMEAAQAIAAGAQQLAASIGEIGRQSAESDRAVQRVRDDIGNGVEAVAELTKAAESVDKVVVFIRDIAEQTNLLALNATIEAARAGEAGKGFAVVASEVKALANQTAKATDDIAHQIAAMQQATGRTRDAIEAITRQADSVAEVVTAIAAAVEEQAAATSEIDRHLQTTTTMSEETAERMARLREDSEQNFASVSELRDAAQRISEQADELEGAADRFVAMIQTR